MEQLEKKKKIDKTFQTNQDYNEITIGKERKYMRKRDRTDEKGPEDNEIKNKGVIHLRIQPFFPKKIKSTVLQTKARWERLGY